MPLVLDGLLGGVGAVPDALRSYGRVLKSALVTGQVVVLLERYDR